MRLHLLGAATALVLLSTQAWAQEAPPLDDPFAGTEGLSGADLDAQTIVADILVAAAATQTLTATNTGNTVTGETIGSGDIILGPDALSGFDGIGNFVLNTGHNNNLQGSIAVIIAIAPAPTS